MLNIIFIIIILVVFIINLRVVYWNDANGSTFVMAKIGNDWFEDHDIVVEDCTVRIIILIDNNFEFILDDDFLLNLEHS